MRADAIRITTDFFGKTTADLLAAAFEDASSRYDAFVAAHRKQVRPVIHGRVLGSVTAEGRFLPTIHVRVGDTVRAIPPSELDRVH